MRNKVETRLKKCKKGGKTAIFLLVDSENFSSTSSVEEQTTKFLTDKKLNLLLGTVDKNGDPFIHPVWFLYENEKLYVETSKTSKKVQNIHHKNTVYFCIDDENLPYIGVRGKALVKISTDVEDNIPIAERIMVKYTGDLKNEVAKMLMDGVKDGQSAILEISPTYYSTWDHSES